MVEYMYCDINLSTHSYTGLGQKEMLTCRADITVNKTLHSGFKVKGILLMH